MDRPESQKLPKHRIVVLVLLIFGVLACYFTVMFNLQIVHGAEYRSQSLSQIVRTTTVEAARAFVPPPFLGEEKTESGDFSMSAYWHATRGSGREG